MLTKKKKNAQKTPKMRVEGRKSTPLLLGSEPIEPVQWFIYLSSIVSETGEKEETSRVAKTQTTFTHRGPCGGREN